MSYRQKGFTVIELIIVIIALTAGSWLFFSEKARVNAVQRDAARKVAINAMYYNLEEVYYPANGYYPTSINSKVLRAMDPSLFVDPNGHELGTSTSNYQYNATGCSTDGHCTSYTLRSTMEREADYIKRNRSHSTS